MDIHFETDPIEPEIEKWVKNHSFSEKNTKNTFRNDGIHFTIKYILTITKMEVSGMENKPNHYDGSVQAVNGNQDLLSENETLIVTDEMRKNIAANPYVLHNEE